MRRLLAATLSLMALLAIAIPSSAKVEAVRYYRGQKVLQTKSKGNALFAQKSGKSTKPRATGYQSFSNPRPQNNRYRPLSQAQQTRSSAIVRTSTRSGKLKPRLVKVEVKDESPALLNLPSDDFTSSSAGPRGSTYSLAPSDNPDLTSATRLQMKAEEPKKQEKKWSLMLDSWNEFNIEKQEYGEADVTANNMVRLGYNLTPNVQVQATMEFTNSWGRTQTGQEAFAFFDPWVGIQGNNIGTLPAGLLLKGHLRVYLPLSQESQTQDQITQIRLTGSISKPIGNFAIGYSGSNRFFAHEYNSTTMQDGKVVGHLYYRYMHTLDLSYTFSKLFSLYTKNGLDHRWFYGDADLGVGEVYQERFISETGLSFSGLAPLSLTVGLNEGSRDLLRQSNDFSLWRPSDTELFVEATIVF